MLLFPTEYSSCSVALTTSATFRRLHSVLRAREPLTWAQFFQQFRDVFLQLLILVFDFVKDLQQHPSSIAHQLGAFVAQSELE